MSQANADLKGCPALLALQAVSQAPRDRKDQKVSIM